MNWIIRLALGLFFTQICNAEIYYPELQVSPRASERLLMEAKQEAKDNGVNLRPLQLSAGMTLLSAVYAGSQTPAHEKASEQEAAQARNVAMAVGASWLIGSYFIEQKYHPYSNGYAEIKSMPSGSTQEQLTRERIAEEHIESAGGVGRRLMWLSLATNFGASAYLASRSDKEPMAVAYLSTALAFAPIVFQTNWQKVSQYHREYKKKIYGPVVTSALLPGKNSFSPGVQLAWAF